MYYNHPSSVNQSTSSQSSSQPSTSSSTLMIENNNNNNNNFDHRIVIDSQQSTAFNNQNQFTLYPYTFYPQLVDNNNNNGQHTFHNTNGDNFHDENIQNNHHQQQQTDNFGLLGHPTTLYQNRSVSIINCEYKLKEKYPHLITLIFFFIIYITIILLGTSLFMAFELKAEQRLRDQIMNKQQLFLEENQCVDFKELKQFIKTVIITYDKGVNLALLNDIVDSMPSQKNIDNDVKAIVNNDEILIGKNNNITKVIVIDKHSTEESDNDNNIIEEIIVTERKQIQAPSNEELSPYPRKEGERVKKTSTLIIPIQMSNWEFGSSLTYVASVVTTIGYGHVTPITNEGKILTIVFGAISIPCTLLFLSIIISMIRDGPIKQIEVWLIKLFGYFTEEVTLLKIRFLHLFIVTMVLFSALIIIPAILFKQMESEWSFLDSFYYCFITLTTVGLGDFVPGQNGTTENRTLYLIGIVIYMYFGLCLMMLWIALVLRIPYFNFKTFLVIEEPELLERKLIDEHIRQQQQHHHAVINSNSEDEDDEDDARGHSDERSPLISSTSLPPSYSLMASRPSSSTLTSSLMVPSTSSSPPSSSNHSSPSTSSYHQSK